MRASLFLMNFEMIQCQWMQKNIRNKLFQTSVQKSLLFYFKKLKCLTTISNILRTEYKIKTNTKYIFIRFNKCAHIIWNRLYAMRVFVLILSWKTPRKRNETKRTKNSIAQSWVLVGCLSCTQRRVSCTWTHTKQSFL